MCAGSATSIVMGIWYNSFASSSHFSASSPVPSNEPGRVRGFHTPARNNCMFIALSAAAVSSTCSRVSALHGPAIIKGLADLKKDIVQR